jgi:CheY-like chemotaxis protein
MEVDRGPLAGQPILVLEDEPLLALELDSTFRSAGARVDVAMDGEKALRAIERLGLSAAVVDINLGREDCSTVCERLSDAGIPFVFFTGEARPEVMLRWPSTPVLTKLASKQRIIKVLAGLMIAAAFKKEGGRTRVSAALNVRRSIAAVSP